MVKDRKMNGTSKRYPDFFKVYLPECSSERLMIPPKFARKYGDELSATATLSVGNGRAWRVGLAKAENSVYFHDGWHEFVEYYSIRHGHFLVFSYKGLSNFHVVIFDTTACEINYPFNGPSSKQEPNHDKQYPVLNEDEMKDDSIEILGFTTPSAKRVFNKSSTKQAMNKRYNSSLKQDCPPSTASVDSSKNGNGNETRSKKREVEDWVEIMDLDSVNESSQGKIRKNYMSSLHGSSLDKTKDNKKHPNKNVENLQASFHNSRIRINQSKPCGDMRVRFNEGGHTKTATEVGSANKKTKPCAHELSTKPKDDVKIIVCEGFSNRYKKMSKEKLRAIRAAKLFRPKNPSFLVILAPYNISATFNMYVPVAFARKYLSRDSKYLTLQDSDGRQWPAQIEWRHRGGLNLRKGWNEFSRSNNLEEGDVCIFELIKTNDVVLKVSIFHASTE